MKKQNFILFLIFIVFASFLFTSIVIAANGQGVSGSTNSGTIKLDNPLGDSNPNPQQLIGKIINAVLGIVGSLALAMFIYGGFTWMLAGGNSEAVTKGKNILIWATLGLVVIFTSYALVHFVIFQGLLGTKQ